MFQLFCPYDRCGNVGALMALVPAGAFAQTAANPRSPRTSPRSSRRNVKRAIAQTVAPMSLVTYEEARPFVRAIKQRVETRQMPPWHLDKNVGINSTRTIGR